MSAASDLIEHIKIAKNNQEFQELIDSLSGEAWRNFATAKYRISISEEKSHEDAMRDVRLAIIELAKRIIGD